MVARKKKQRGQRCRCPRPDKIAFADKTSAQKSLAAMRKHNPDDLDLIGMVVYYCEPGCGYWHHGHQQRTGRILRLLEQVAGGPVERIA